MNKVDQEMTQERKDEIVRHAMDIRIMECEFKENIVNSDDEVLRSTHRTMVLVYNQSVISEQEVVMLLKNNDYAGDQRIVLLTPEQAANIFPNAKWEERYG